ncbi:hypothetical protein [Moritella dasanensis]|uniref:hypothetical protein n=1 Tax=Moritella dasanensis TaxID=428031 RepID=UPI00030C0831|nr:hypothetical protein [Moritella dasanensis]
MKHSSYFKKSMLLASLLSWVLVTLMPVLNANNSVGVWATLCTVNGLELVQIEEGKPQTHEGKPCPFSHFSSFHDFALLTAPTLVGVSFSIQEHYSFLAHSLRYQWQVPRAPPAVLS